MIRTLLPPSPQPVVATRRPAFLLPTTRAAPAPRARAAGADNNKRAQPPFARREGASASPPFGRARGGCAATAALPPAASGALLSLLPLPSFCPPGLSVFSQLPFSVRSPDRNWGARPVCDRAPGSIPPGRALPGPAPRSPLRGLRPSGDDPCRLRSLRSLRAPLATGTTEAGAGRRADRPAHFRTLRPRSRAKNLNRTLAQLRRRREGLTREGSCGIGSRDLRPRLSICFKNTRTLPLAAAYTRRGSPPGPPAQGAALDPARGARPPQPPTNGRFAPWTPDRGCAPGPACRALP